MRKEGFVDALALLHTSWFVGVERSAIAYKIHDSGCGEDVWNRILNLAGERSDRKVKSYIFKVD